MTTTQVTYKGMPYRRLGRTGLKVSQFGLGGWTTFGGSVTDEAAGREIIRAAFDAGINFFDIADVYARGESERFMGKALAELPRHELVISSKVYWPMSDDPNDRGLSRKHVMESVEKSLRRIGTDYLDMYFCHRFDPETPVDETVRAMDDLIRQGKVLYWGTSEWSSTQIVQAARSADRRNLELPTVEQPEYSLLRRRRFEDEIAPTCQELGMGTVTFSPLATGLLTGKYDQGMPEGARLSRLGFLKDRWYQDELLERSRAFGRRASEWGYDRSQIALAWTASHPAVSSVILGATRLDQLKANLKALEVTVTPEMAAALDEIFPKA